jgi:hypothetical protein
MALHAGPQGNAGASRPDANTARQAAATILAVAALAIGVFGCGLGSEAPGEEAASSAVAAKVNKAAPPPERQVEAVLDPSGSVPRHYLTASLKALADAVRAIPKPLPPTGSSPARPAVAITVRAVATDSYSPAGRLLSGTVKEVPEIAALPDDANADLTGAVVEVAKQREKAERAEEEAEAEAEALADRITALDPPVTTCSDVVGAASASAQSFTSSDRRLVMVTDLSQSHHCPANAAGTLRGVRVVTVHICTTAARCQAQEALWRRRLTDRGATSVRFTRFENLYPTMRSLVAGG